MVNQFAVLRSEIPWKWSFWQIKLQGLIVRLGRFVAQRNVFTHCWGGSYRGSEILTWTLSGVLGMWGINLVVKLNNDGQLFRMLGSLTSFWKSYHKECQHLHEGVIDGCGRKRHEGMLEGDWRRGTKVDDVKTVRRHYGFHTGTTISDLSSAWWSSDSSSSIFARW